MEERNPMEGKARIVGLDLSKKTFVGCNLTGERFEKRSFFNGRMDEAGREKLASRLTEKDIVFMEGGVRVRRKGTEIVKRKGTDLRIVK